MAALARIPWRKSIVVRLILAWSAVLAGLVLLFGALSWMGARRSLVDTWRENLAHDATMTRMKFQAAVASATRDVVSLSRTPALAEFLAADEDAERDRWRRFVEREFQALLEGKPTYFQARLIGLEDDGREVVRIDSTNGRIAPVSQGELQRKGDRDYFQEALRLGPEAVYLSPINLNQEYGKVALPHTPTLRVARKVLRPDGRVFGVLVVNVDLGPLLRELQNERRQAVDLTVAREDGDYLIHPDPAKMFGSDLGREGNFWKDRPTPSPQALAAASWTSPDRADDLTHAIAFSLGRDTPRRLIALVSVPSDRWLALLRTARNKAILYTALAGFAAAAGALILGRWLSARLHRVTSAIASYQAGMDTSGLPPAEPDELGRLAGAFRQMAEKVRDQVASLEAARKEAEEATRVKEEFLAVMSHEIRTPMNAISGLIHVLERNQPPPHQEPVLRTLRTATANLMALLNEALDYTKLRAGRLEFARRPFAPRETLTEILAMHRASAMQKGLSLDLEVDPATPEWVLGDRLRFTQIVTNLLANAIKFTDEGFVSVNVERPALGELRVTVHDSGVGIPKDLHESIFRPFAQAPRSDGRQTDGSGLGLSITHALVEQQGGGLIVESDVGRGAAFTVTLPLEEASRPEPAASEEAVPLNLSGVSILCVEDVPSNREVVSLLLGGSGCELTFAEDGASALDVISRRRFDLALLDLQLPDTTGVELARRIRLVAPNLPLIAVTAQAGAKTVEECSQAGMEQVILKPIDPAEFARALKRRLGKGSAKASFATLESLFQSQPERLAKLKDTLREEFRQHSRELAVAFRENDGEALRAARHRLHSAIRQLGMDQLGQDLERLISDGGGVVADRAAQERVLRALESAFEE